MFNKQKQYTHKIQKIIIFVCQSRVLSKESEIKEKLSLPLID